MTNQIKDFFHKPFWSDYRTTMALWLLLGVISALVKIGKWNNFLIFRGVFWHTWNGTSLYEAYPEEYFDVNHYGPLFSLIIAPFAVTPEVIGCVLWNTMLALALYMAVRQLPLLKWQHLLVFWFCAHELLTALFMQQFNIATAAMIIATFYCIEKERDMTAAFFIVVGTLVKIYGIVGLAFFFFSRHKTRLIAGLAIWSLVLFALPMIISSPEYIISQYVEWFTCLTGKNAENLDSIAQNISLLGLVRRVGVLLLGAEAFRNYSDIWLILAGCVTFCLPYLRFKQWKNYQFRLMFLASILMFVVLFSTGSESSGYIIPFVGVCLWYACVPWKRNGWDIALMVFAFVLSSLSPSDLFPAFVRKEIVQPYSLKALPIVVIWLKLEYEMMTRGYDNPVTPQPPTL
ncbi:MAG: DUF2029 domain-containing protein [Bacteroidaceae bacterium]|nr:DUF2029 domain-containing protein [Bacteroidaceae bacterium]